MRNLALMCVLAAAIAVMFGCGGKAGKTSALDGGGIAAEDTSDADVDYCVYLKKRGPLLLFVKQRNELVIRTAEEDEKQAECESPFGGGFVKGWINFVDKSGASITTVESHYITGAGYGSMMEYKGPHYLPREIEIGPPGSLWIRNSKMPKEEEENIFRELLRFKDKNIDGYMMLSPACEPHKLEYTIKFRAKITGECECDSIDGFGTSQARIVAVRRDPVRVWTSGAATLALKKDGTLTVSGNGAMGDYDDDRFGDEAYRTKDRGAYDSLRAVYLAPWANINHWENISITDLIFEDGVTSIGKDAFRGCKDLKSVTFPNSVTHIGDGAFKNCEKLTSVTIPNGVTSIGKGVFESCYKLKSVTIPNGVTSIGDRAFLGCYNLLDVTIPNSVTSIGDEAFGSCNRLTSVTIPNSVTSIGTGPFFSCDSLKSIDVAADNAHYRSVDGILFNKNKTALIQYLQNRRGPYTIPDGVASIGGLAFKYCFDLTSVTFPNSVTSIGDEAFYHCGGLMSVTLPNGVASIGEYAFYGCERMTSITLPNSAASIGRGAFSGCDRLTSVTIPSGLTSVEMELFNGCDRLKSITIPNSVMSIGKWAFGNLPELKSITIPNSVTSIGDRAFENCGLTSASIGKSVASIGDGAFMNCGALKSITVLNPTPPKLGDKPFRAQRIVFQCLTGRDWESLEREREADTVSYAIDLDSACLYVPKSSLAAYRAADTWKEFKCIKGIKSVP